MISRGQMVILSLIVCGDLLLGAASAWMMPDRVPVHWNIQGQADRYGSPWELAAILSGTIFGSALLLIALPAMGNAGKALERSQPTYGRMAIAVVCALVVIHLIVVLRGVSHPLDVVSAVLADLGVLIAVLGNWTSKIRRNALAGIRTPWTLKSDFVWERTNRLGGRLQVALGILVVAAAICLPVWAAVAVLMSGLFALVIWAMIYSRSLAQQLAQGS